MSKLPELTVLQAQELILKKLKIKIVPKSYNFVRRHNSLKRIVEYLDKEPLWQSKYENANRTISSVANHYFLDLWVGDDLLTFRCKKNDKDNR